MLKILSDKLLDKLIIDDDLLSVYVDLHINNGKVKGTSSSSLKHNNIIRSFTNMNSKSFAKFLEVIPIDAYELKLTVTAGSNTHEVKINKTTMRGKYVTFGDTIYYKDTSSGTLVLIDIESIEYRDLIIKD